MSANALAIQEDLVKAGDDLNDAICPPRAWARDNICDVAFLTYSYNIRIENQLVEVTLRYKLERCTLDYVLCDLAHSMTRAWLLGSGTSAILIISGVVLPVV